MKEKLLFTVCVILLPFSGSSQSFVEARINISNGSIQLNPDQVLEIKLPATPSTGYTWVIKETTRATNIQQIEQSSFVSDNPRQLEGQSGDQILRFIPTGNGSNKLELEYRRPWESDAEILSTYNLTVNTVGAYTGNYIPLKEETSIEPPIELEKSQRALPSSFSWVSKCTPAKNQASCGSCWAFATVGSFEAVVNIWDNNSPDFSEQWLVNCEKSFSGCSGGSYAFSMFTKNPGAVSEKTLPYKAQNGTCASSYTYNEKAKSYGTVPNNVTQMKQALYDYGPMYVSICSGNNLHNYKSGVITKTDGTQTNHGVLLSGWDDAGGYWIIKNSWGASFGESGFFRIKYGLSAVGTKVAYVNYKGIIPHNTTGVSELSNRDVVVSPNPSSDGHFTISGVKNNSTIEVYDIIGHLIYQSTSHGIAQQINLSAQTKGLYFYKIVELETNSVTQGKLILN